MVKKRSDTMHIYTHYTHTNTHYTHVHTQTMPIASLLLNGATCINMYKSLHTLTYTFTHSHMHTQPYTHIYTPKHTYTLTYTRSHTNHANSYLINEGGHMHRHVF